MALDHGEVRSADDVGTVLSVFVQVWIQIEVGRWTVLTGESAFTGFAQLNDRIT